LAVVPLLRRLFQGHLSRAVDRWSSPRFQTASSLLLGLAFTALFLNAAATVEVGFTLQVSYGATAAAILVGGPIVLRGWRRLPPRLRLAACSLIAAYVLVGLLGDPRPLAGATRSSHRSLVYLADLTLGVAAVGLVVGLADTPQRLRRLIVCFAAGALAGAIIGLYQWLSLHFGWPLSDLNTAPNSDGFSTGHRFQGAGLLGWERARGTFKEPLFFATFLATAIPVLAALAWRSASHRRGLSACGLCLTVLVLVLTISSLAWGVLLMCVLSAACLLAVAHRRVGAATAAGAALTAAVVLGPVVFVNPGVVSLATGRSSQDVSLTAANRIGAWRNAMQAWERRPLIGDGLGQSAVRLAYRPDGGAIAPGVTAPEVLGSAQGLWAASLVDGGLLELMAWTMFLGGAAMLLVRAVLRRPDPLVVGLTTAAAVAVLAAQFAGDRLEVRVWLVLGLAVAAASQVGGEQAAEGNGQAEARA